MRNSSSAGDTALAPDGYWLICWKLGGRVRKAFFAVMHQAWICVTPNCG